MNLKLSHKFLIVATILLCLMVLFSCKSGKPLTTTIKDSTNVQVTVTPFDTTLWISKHIGKAQEFTNCDSLYALLSRHNDSLTSKDNGVKSTIVKRGKRLVFKCETDSLKAVISLLKTKIKETRVTTVTKEVESKCKKEHLSKIDSFFIITGRILWCIVILIGIGKAMKMRFPSAKILRFF